MRIGFVIASALLAASCDAVPEQEPEQAQAVGGASAEGATDGIDASEVPVGQPVTSATFVAFAANSDLFEIEAGKLAMKSGQSAVTRQFGKMMVEDHTASTRELKAAIEKSEITVVLPTRLDAERQGLLDRLAQANAADFDRQYMNQQIEGHREALKVHQEYQALDDDQNLRAFSQKVLPVIQGHYDVLDKDNAARGRAPTGAIKQ